MDRRDVTFAQAEGAAPLPRRLELGEVSQQLRVRLAEIFHLHLSNTSQVSSFYRVLGEPWNDILYSYHIDILHRFPSGFDSDLKEHLNSVERIFGDYNLDAPTYVSYI